MIAPSLNKPLIVFSKAIVSLIIIVQHTRITGINTLKIPVTGLQTEIYIFHLAPFIHFIKTVYGAGYCLELPSGNHLTDCIALMAEFRAQQQQRELSAQV